jgi:hypothetical protein
MAATYAGNPAVRRPQVAEMLDYEAPCRQPERLQDRHIEPVARYWLTFKYPDGRFAGVAVVEASALVSARMMAAVYGSRHWARLRFRPSARSGQC